METYRKEWEGDPLFEGVPNSFAPLAEEGLLWRRLILQYPLSALVSTVRALTEDARDTYPVRAQDAQPDLSDYSVDIHFPRPRRIVEPPEPGHDLAGNISPDVVFVLEGGDEGRDGGGCVREGEGYQR